MDDLTSITRLPWKVTRSTACDFPELLLQFVVELLFVVSSNTMFTFVITVMLSVQDKAS